MKRACAVLTISLFAVAALYAAGAKDTAKTAACKAACMKTKEKCDQKAGGNMLKKAACEKSYEKCLKDCEKEKK